MSNETPQKNKTPKHYILPIEASLALCKRQGYREIAQEIVDALPDSSKFSPRQFTELVMEQLSKFAQDLSKCIERANQAEAIVDELPSRSQQGAALRRIMCALEGLRDAVDSHWELVAPLLEIEVAGQLGALLTTEGVQELLPVRLRSEFLKMSAKHEDDRLLGIKRSYLLRAGSWPLTRMIDGAEIAVRRAEKRIVPGAPPKAPFEIALIVQLADHHERVLGKKASAVTGGPFERFCGDIFENLGLETVYTWEHLLRAGLDLYKNSLFMRRRHEPVGQPNVEISPRKRKPRKTVLRP